MLSILATLKEFQGTLLGADIHVFMDYKNLRFNTLKTQRVLCWHAKIEEFSPMLHYIEGPRNILANNLSRFHCLVTPAQIAEGKKLVEPAEVSIEEEDKAYFLDQEYSGLYNEDVWECIECYLNLPDTPHPDENPLNYAHIHELQQQDEQLLALQVKYQTIMPTYNWMTTLMTSSVIRKIPLNPIGKLCSLNQWQLILSNGSTK